MSTRRTYIAISGAIKSQQPNIPEHSTWRMGYTSGLKCAAEAIADALQELHPSGFDRARFLKDCGVEP